jgi:L-lactate dehydrogenase (cytochrome)
VRRGGELRRDYSRHSRPQEHPGGSKIILSYAGRDATSAYEPIHPPDALVKNIPPHKHLGPLASAAVASLVSAQRNKEKTQDELRMERAEKSKPPLSQILNLADMEVGLSRLPGWRILTRLPPQEVAKSLISYKALAYYASAADDEICEYSCSLRRECIMLSRHCSLQ